LSNRVIPKESLTGLRRVELGDFAGSQRAEPARQDAQAGSGDALARAREEGYRQGLADASRESASQLELERRALTDLVARMGRFLQDFEEGLAEDVLSMSLELAKLIVRHSVKVKPELVLPVLREAIATLPSIDGRITVRLHPADAHLLRKLAETDQTLAALPWRIVEDAQLERGGCVVDTATTEVDATLETRWRRVLAALGRDDLWVDVNT